MAKGRDLPRDERLKEFFRRLVAAPPAFDHDEAFRQVADVLNRVEDELTSIPFDPNSPLNDGRMYPPRPDSKKAMPGRTDVTRYRSKGHSTLIGDNGAIQIIVGSSGPVIFEKPGADGRTL